MKKIALSLTAASMIFSGLAGCGDVNDTGMNDTRTGYTTNQNQGAGTTGFGANSGHGTTGSQAYPGVGQGGYGDYNHARGIRGSGYGNYPADYATRPNRNIGQGAGLVHEERNFGSAYDYNTGARGADITGNRGTGNTTSGFQARGDRQHRGFGRGITGDDRAGMVDENGVLNDFRGKQDIGSGTARTNHGIGARDGQIDGARGFNHRTARNGNVHGTGNTGQANVAGYYNGEDGRLSRRISDRLTTEDGFRNSQVIVHGNDVVIAVENGDDMDDIDNQVNSRVRNLTGDRNVHVVTDREHVRNIRGMNDRLRAGEPFEEIGATFNDMISDLGNAIQRPFERSR
ncbi:YhcN/YlaJ family sporulation lipoprotein [Evansella sp. AB-rgal1]|uniref:YhcN/YlaJ family sporulation lipoprotein n=1 Tax=Evansella sp. AB-rgal1 TaxID=3242696 RepID=UPI00359ED37D